MAVFQQYPAEISNRRKELIPKMMALKREGHPDVRLVLDKLYVGKHLVNDTPFPLGANVQGPLPGAVPVREPPYPPRGPPPVQHAGPRFPVGHR